MKKNLAEKIKAHLYGNMDRLTKATAATIEGNTATITFEITENVGKKNQESHTETAKFEIMQDHDRYRNWQYLDEIDETPIEVFQWMNDFNEALNKEAHK